MQYGFIEDVGKRYFMNADGTLYKKGWLGDSLNMMYMDTKDGHMLTDLVEIGGKKYYFDSNGLMQRGMIPLNGKIYLFGADGAMQYGFYSDPTAGTRYFKTDGSMAANELLTVGTNKYYFNTNGVMATGLTNIGGVTYLFGADGAMQYGWYTDASGMRYFQTNGAMAVNTTLAVGGVTYV
ncbi:N-acetylmuramoyl-L-alanine amidase family protein, partial [Gallintestinimicrobium sp.]|uniref:N-acetylmuramoyl-L-alanine amidase family protein n=1 Tax=Gallintestinimicrobium sp. TaxID=2981655 RepID=UPI003993B4C7